jgi:hypothetical protein
LKNTKYIGTNFYIKKTKMKRNRATVFLSIGLLIISATQVALHFTKMPDFISGVLLGIGLGVMLLSFKRQKSNPAC